MPTQLLSRVIECAGDKEIAELSDNDFVDYFSSGSDDVRKVVLRRVVKALSKTRLKKLLARYSKFDGSRYYTVLYWLDLGISLTHKQVIHTIEAIARKRRSKLLRKLSFWAVVKC